MKKILFVLLYCMMLKCTVLAQSPNAIPYQGVARNASGDVLSTQAITLRISLRDGTAAGIIVYQETHNATTTALGLFNVNIGTGTPSVGTLSAVNWGNGAKFIQVELDPTGGTTYTDMGTSQLMSVPYALFAGKSNDLPAGTATGNTLRWNGTAWVADNALFNNGTNVGIGTATPAAKLDVAGNIKITDGTQGAGKVLKSDAAGLASWGTLSGTDILSTPLVPNLSCPVTIGSVATASGPISVAVSGNYAYVVNLFGNTMQVINISNPAAPTVAGSVATGTNSRSVAVSGNYAYVANFNSNTMQVIDISNPLAPTVAGSVATASGPYSVAVSGNYANVANYSSNTMQVINISNPLAPIVAGSVATGTIPRSVDVSGNYAYVVNYNSNTMQVINISNPAAPTVAGSVATGNNPISVAESGNYAYVVNYNSNTMQVINISNPAAPVVVGSVGTGSQPRSVAVAGNYAYVANETSNTMQVINISNPLAPTVAGSVATGTNPRSVDVSGNYAYVVNYNSNTMQVINLACSENFAVTVNPATGQTTAITQQWNTSGNTISNSNTGNVGIGTTTPLANLHVSKSAPVDNDPTNPANNIFRATSGSVSIDLGIINNGNTYMQSRYTANNGVFPLLLNPQGGQVGIGATSPLSNSKLHVVQSTLGSFAATFEGVSPNTESTVALRLNGNNAYVSHGGWGLGANNLGFGGQNFAFPNLLINTLTGNVGIGTTAPSNKLEVTGNTQYLVRGTNTNTNQNHYYGVYGSTNNTPGWGTGVGGLGGDRGVEGVANAPGTGSRTGVYGYATGGATNYGVYGSNSVGAGAFNNYGVYSSGHFTCTGTKAATVKTPDGPRELYSQESPENWFEDFGKGTIQNGVAIVTVAPDYEQTVTINATHPMHAFITPNGNMGNWWIEYKGNSFTVHAPTAANGTAFDYRMVAKRKGYETLRLKKAPGAYTDKFLYPDVNEVPAEYREDWLKQNAPKDEVKTQK
jgi:hypothetical protein